MRPTEKIRPRFNGNWPAVAARLIEFARLTRTKYPTYARTGEWRATEIEILAAAADLRQFTHYLRTGFREYAVPVPLHRRRFGEQLRIKESTKSVLRDVGCPLNL